MNSAKTIHCYNKWPFHNKTYLTVWVLWPTSEEKTYVYTTHGKKAWKIVNRWVRTKFGSILQSKRPVIVVISHMENEKGGDFFSLLFSVLCCSQQPPHPAQAFKVISSDILKPVTKRQINHAKGLNPASTTGWGWASIWGYSVENSTAS